MDELWPIERDELIRWHRQCAQLSNQSDDFSGARMHADRAVFLTQKHAQKPDTRVEKFHCQCGTINCDCTCGRCRRAREKFAASEGEASV